RLGAGPSHLPPVPQTPRVTSGRQKNRSVRPASSLPPRPAPRGPGSAVPVDAAIWVPPAEPDSPGADGLSASGGAALAVALAFAAGAHVTARLVTRFGRRAPQPLPAGWAPLVIPELLRPTPSTAASANPASERP